MEIHCTNSDSNYWIKRNNAIPTTLNSAKKRTNIKKKTLAVTFSNHFTTQVAWQAYKHDYKERILKNQKS